MMLALTLFAAIFFFTAFSEVRAQTAVGNACAQLQSKLGSVKLATQNNQTVFTASAELNWSPTARLTPACIVLPLTAHDVATAMSIVSATEAPFAIRSGGHSWNPGFSNIEGGVLISLEKMVEIDLDEDNGLVVLGPGLRWVEVYDALKPHGVVVAGGRIPDVGVGGLILGGGLSSISGEHGLTCDNTVGYEVVLANGTIIQVDASHSADLFFALKGGSSNFGIVTKYTVKTVRLDTQYLAELTYALPECNAALDVFAAYQLAASQYPEVSASVNFASNSCVAIIFSSVPREMQPGVEGFFKLPTASAPVVRNQSFADIVGSFAGLFPATGRDEFRAVSSRADTCTAAELAAYYKDVKSIWISKTAAAAQLGNDYALSIQPYTQSMIDAGKKAGGNALGADYPMSWINVFVNWESATQDAELQGVLKGMTDGFAAAAVSHGLQTDFLYMNDAFADQPVLKGYGASNLAKLRKAAQRYDPAGVFQKLQNNGYLLSRS